MLIDHDNSRGDRLYAQEGDNLYVEYTDTTLPRVGPNGESWSKSRSHRNSCNNICYIWISICDNSLIMSVLKSVMQNTTNRKTHLIFLL